MTTKPLQDTGKYAATWSPGTAAQAAAAAEETEPIAATAAAIPYYEPPMRRRLFVLIPLVVAAGLLTRPAARFLPHFLTDMLGDMLYTVLIALLVALCFSAWPRWKIFAGAVAFCWAIEFSQLYHVRWLDAVRHTLPGVLILGRGFSPFDLLWYLVGGVIGVGLVSRQKRITRQFQNISSR